MIYVSISNYLIFPKMSAGVDTVDNKGIEDTLFSLCLQEEEKLPSTTYCSNNYMYKCEEHDSSINTCLSNNEQITTKEKQKKKRRKRKNKKVANMSVGEETADNEDIEQIPVSFCPEDGKQKLLSSTACSNNCAENDFRINTCLSKHERVATKEKINRCRKNKEVPNEIKTKDLMTSDNDQTLTQIVNDFSIKAIRFQNCGFAFHKRNRECQYIVFDYQTKLNGPYVFDSREFVKFQVFDEQFIDTNNKTTLANGINSKYNKNDTNEINNLQSALSQGTMKKRKQKRNIVNKENKKVIPFKEHLKFEDVATKLALGELIKGPIRINPKNHKTAYVSNTDRTTQDYIINSIIDRNRALEGDVVALQLKPETEWIENQKSAIVTYILEKVHPRIAIGSLSIFYDKGRKLAALQPRDKRIPRIVINQTSLPPMYFQNANEYNDILFLVKITDWNNPKFAEGMIIERVGVKNDLANETTAILLENQLDVTPFPQSVYKYLPSQTSIPETEFTYREDLRKECIFTIDPLTARDLDDAVSCKRLSNGNLEVGVHISDVGFYLAENTELDEIVSKKGTTIYLIDNVYHMLPVELCMHCSLLPGKDCLAFSVFFEMTEEGEILSHRFSRTIINSCCQLAYEHAQQMIDEGESFSGNDLPNIYNQYSASDLCDIVNKLRKISANLRQKRFDNGALRIDQTKILFKLNVNGEPDDFFRYENIEAHRLIEELMLLANITVARKLLEDFPKIAFLRCHEPPNPRLIKESQGVLEKVGIHIDISSAGAIHSSLQNYCTPDYFGVARAMVLNHIFAKPMTRAKYFCACVEENYSHYALSVDTYTHFTSPIRRYADIMVHRLLAASLGYSPKPTWEVDYVHEIAANCNKQKYNAKKAGEASADLFLVYYVERNQPFIQDAVVIDVRDQSFHVMVLNTGTVVRLYLNNLGNNVQYKTEEVEDSEKKKKKITLMYENNTNQVIEIFQIVKVQLKRKANTFSLEGHLVQPEGT